MLVKDVVETDFLNYKVPSMYVAFPYCSFKCEKDCGIQCCHNSALARAQNIEISAERIVEIYARNTDFTKAIVLAGLEPLDSFGDVIDLVSAFRERFDDSIVIYTGYTEDEAATYIQGLQRFTNIIVKFGRFVPDKPHRVDEVLGVELASDNQYAKKIS